MGGPQVETGAGIDRSGLGLAPFVSIVVLSLNGEAYIRDCLRSLSESNYPTFEILVVNNGSTDSTPHIVSGEFPQVRLINLPKNLGFAGGMNEGLKAALGDVLVPFNDDTVATPNLIRNLVAPFQECDRIGMVGCKILYPDGRTLQHAGAWINPNGSTNHYGYHELDDGQHDQLRDVEYVTGCVVAIRRELFEKLGLFDDRYYPTYYEETEFAVRARKIGYRVVYNPKAVLYHLESMTQVVGSQNFLFRYHRSRWRFVLKNFSARELARAFKHEYRYYKSTAADAEQRRPLLRAYRYVLVRLPSILWDRLFRFLPIPSREEAGRQSSAGSMHLSS